MEGLVWKICGSERGHVGWEYICKTVEARRLERRLGGAGVERGGGMTYGMIARRYRVCK